MLTPTATVRSLPHEMVDLPVALKKRPFLLVPNPQVFTTAWESTLSPTKQRTPFVAAAVELHIPQGERWVLEQACFVYGNNSDSPSSIAFTLPAMSSSSTSSLKSTILASTQLSIALT